MADRMLHFTHLDKEMPDKRASDARVGDFHEIYGEFIADKAAAQAGRCSQCGVPYCQVHCPLHNNIPDWLMLTANGRLEEAFETAQATNTFPEICGRICPQDRLCEGSCVIEQSGHGTVTIGAVEKYITETAWDNGWVRPHRAGPDRGQSVGIIGAGPAGLAAAEMLRRQGYAVTVYDRYDRIGGLLIYGIPNFKLEKSVVARRADWLTASGITFRMNFEIGRDASLQDLRTAHDAILIATGVYKARDLDIPGAGLTGVYPALDYLITSNRTGLGDQVTAYADGTLNAHGKRVVVIGGGDTAMDCVRTAVRQGAVSVTCLYRRDRANMPGSDREVANAEEGRRGVPLAVGPARAPWRYPCDSGPYRTGPTGPARCVGTPPPELIDGEDVLLDADMVIKALGFEPEDLPRLFDCPELPLTEAGTIEVHRKTMKTALPGVFAAGDIVRGASLVVWAIREGRDAAAAIHAALAQKAAA